MNSIVTQAEIKNVCYLCTYYAFSLENGLMNKNKHNSQPMIEPQQLTFRGAPSSMFCEITEKNIKSINIIY